MLSFLRAPSPPRTSRASAGDTITYEDGRGILHFHAAGDEWAMTHTVPPTTPAHGVSLLQPPPHLHTHQEELFHVASGTARFFLGTCKEPFAVAVAGTETANAHIPKGRYHRFENASAAEPLVIQERKAPEDLEGEQRFFRNIFGYLDDCRLAKMEPSVFQLVVFSSAADTPIALPAPFGYEVLGFWISRVFTSVVAALGRQMGYLESYPEYYQDRKGL